MKARKALAEAVAALDAAGVPGAMRDARLLLAETIQTPTDRLTIDFPELLTPEQAADFRSGVARRVNREPLSHILGRRSFFGRDFKVSGDVLDPRPETETLVSAALEKPFRTVLDLGTGSGCILLTLLAERPDATGMGTDISVSALTVAMENAARIAIPAERAVFCNSDWFSALDRRFDLIISNPPYIAAAEMSDLAPEVGRYEPALALTPGGDGLAAYRTIARGAPDHLVSGGWLMVEIGPTQAPAVCDIFAASDFTDIAVLPDLDSRDRVVQGRKPA